MPADVDLALRAGFAASDWEQARLLLWRAGLVEDAPLGTQVQFAMLHLSAGSLDRLAQLERLAASDRREVVRMSVAGTPELAHTGTAMLKASAARAHLRATAMARDLQLNTYPTALALDLVAHVTVNLELLSQKEQFFGTTRCDGPVKAMSMLTTIRNDRFLEHAQHAEQVLSEADSIGILDVQHLRHLVSGVAQSHQEDGERLHDLYVHWFQTIGASYSFLMWGLTGCGHMDAARSVAGKADYAALSKDPVDIHRWLSDRTKRSRPTVKKYLASLDA